MAGSSLSEKAAAAPPANEDVEKDGRSLSVGRAESQPDHVANSRILKHSHDADEALKAFADREGTVFDISEETNRRLLRKIDFNLMPVSTWKRPLVLARLIQLLSGDGQILCVVYGLNYLDKTTLSYASIMGLTLPPSQGGLGLVGDQYNWLGR